MKLQHNIFFGHNDLILNGGKSDLDVVFHMLKSKNPNVYHCTNLKDSSSAVDLLKQTKPTAEEIALSNRDNLTIGYPIALFILRDENEDINAFLKIYSEYIRSNDFTVKLDDNDDFNLRFVVVIMPNYQNGINNRSLQFHHDFITFKKENDDKLPALGLALNNTFFILLDRYNEKGHKLENTTPLFTQFGQIFTLLFNSDFSNGYLPIQNAKSIPGSEVIYNSIGLSSIGFRTEEIRNGIRIKRNQNFIKEIASNSILSEKIKLEISNLSSGFINQFVLTVRNSIHKNAFDKTFSEYTLKTLEDFKQKQDGIIEHKKTNELEIQLSSILNHIARDYEKFSLTLELAQEESLLFQNELSELFKVELNLFVNGLLDKYDSSDSINTCKEGLQSLLTKPSLHLVKEKSDKKYHTLIDIKNQIQVELDSINPIDFSVHKENLSDLEDEIGKFGDKIDSQINVIEMYNLSGKLKISLLWFILGIIASFMVIWFVPEFHILEFDLITLSSKIKLSLWPLLIGLFISVFKIFTCYGFHNKMTLRLYNFGEDRYGLMQKYVQTYDDYFNSIKTKLILEHSKLVIDSFILNVNKELDIYSKFKKSLYSLKKQFDLQLQNIHLEFDIFNQSLINKNDFSSFCSNHPLYFFEERNVSKFYSEYKLEQDSIEPFFTYKHGQKLEYSQGEVILSSTEDGILFSDKIYVELEENTSQFNFNPENQELILYSDINQGRLGDCYFLAALSSIAHKRKEYIKNMISTNKSNNRLVSFYNEDGIRYEVEIDNKFWIHKETNKPIYANFGNSLDYCNVKWVMYLEKAWAKINSCNYENIIGSNGNNRDIDFSLALTGKEAFKETLETNGNLAATLKRIENHLKNKPIVLYSISELFENTQIRANHAYALISIENENFILYDPHGSILNIPFLEIGDNFDQVLYFDFELEKDEHLHGLYDEYVFKKSKKISFINEMEDVINMDLENNFDNKSLEQLLPSFNYVLNKDKANEFAESLIATSVPNMYTPNLPNEKPQYRMLGENNMINPILFTKLQEKGYPSNSFVMPDPSIKKIGLLQIRNNITIENIERE